MKILAIDPGNELSAWCELEDGQYRRSDKVANDVLLLSLRDNDIRSWKPDLLAVEMIASYGMAVGREVFDTCLWIGRFIEAWRGEHRLVYRKDAKMYHCHSVRATDANIRAALIDVYGPGKDKAIGTKKSPGPLYGLKGDQWSALAVARTAEAQARPFTATDLVKVAAYWRERYSKPGMAA